MDWDRVRREDKYKRGGTQKVAGGDQRTRGKDVLGFRATQPGKCPNCRKAIQVNQMIVFFPTKMKAPVHRGCFY